MTTGKNHHQEEELTKIGLLEGVTLLCFMFMLRDFQHNTGGLAYAKDHCSLQVNIIQKRILLYLLVIYYILF